MGVITISRQLGSLGNEVAQAVSRRLNYPVFCRDLINKAANRAGVPEVALATIDDLGLFGLRPSTEARSAYQQAVKAVMEELCIQGDVILVGRAGQVILRDHPEVLHVKVIAPAVVRAQRISLQLGISIDAARAQIEASDRSRRNYLRRYYHARWDDPELYDLIVNTARLSADAAACLICQALTQCYRRNFSNGN
ncbi:MAG: AAA family ATPase [Anaerolineales bacterium]